MGNSEKLKLKECRRLDDLEFIQVVKIKITRGRGTAEDPVRPVFSYWDMQGNFLFEDDPCNEQSTKEAYRKEESNLSYADILYQLR